MKYNVNITSLIYWRHSFFFLKLFFYGHCMTAVEHSETSTVQQPHLGVMLQTDLSENSDPDQREKCRQGCNIKRPDGFQAEIDMWWRRVIFNSYLLSCPLYIVRHNLVSLEVVLLQCDNRQREFRVSFWAVFKKKIFLADLCEKYCVLFCTSEHGRLFNVQWVKATIFFLAQRLMMMVWAQRGSHLSCFNKLLSPF